MIETVFIGDICPVWEICEIRIGILIDSVHADVHINLCSGKFVILLPLNEYGLDLVGLTNLDTHVADMKEYADPNQIISQARMYTCTNSESINT